MIDVASADLGSGRAQDDCEAWIPTQGKYRELTSTSDCTEFQSRRLSIRVREGKKVRPLATLNGTLCAVPRTIVAILENHQQADGSVRVPGAAPVPGRPGGPGAGGQVTDTGTAAVPGTGSAGGFPYRLIATDLDGTLLRGDDTISQRTRDALAAATAAAPPTSWSPDGRCRGPGTSWTTSATTGWPSAVRARRSTTPGSTGC
ncbi:hypothetical protein STENM36S_01669 [Streptomyces tendae]